MLAAPGSLPRNLTVEYLSIYWRSSGCLYKRMSLSPGVRAMSAPSNAI